MEVTRASGNVIHEIDGRPAFEAYRSYAAGRGLTLDPARAGDFLIANELGVFFLDELRHARAPIGVGSAGELLLVAQVPEGASVCILDGEPASMLAAARRAAEEAQAALAGAPCAGVLVFDCVCRGILLADDFGREIEAVRAVFPSTPVAGFLTYGEIARFRGRLDGWHNTTVVVVAIPAT
jgi:methyl-accepting chemotaxis protein